MFEIVNVHARNESSNLQLAVGFAATEAAEAETTEALDTETTKDE